MNEAANVQGGTAYHRAPVSERVMIGLRTLT